MRLYVTKDLMKVGWQKKHNSLVWEVSELQGRFDDSPGPALYKDGKLSFDSVEVINTDTENHKLFNHSHNDVAENEIHGWNYVSDDGMKLLLIND